MASVGNGIVKYIGTGFPGAVIIIEHNLPPNGLQKIYSLYGHLDLSSVVVSVDQEVAIGQTIGSVMLQFFDGRNTEYHDDSHLHFEMRYFFDASEIYVNYPACNNYLPGRGYTYPQHPDDFPPSQSYHYTDPIVFIQNRRGTFFPLIQRANCINGQQLIANRGFEEGGIRWIEETQPYYSVITNLSLPTPAHNGTWAAWFGGRNNAVERIYQSFSVLPGTTGVNLSYYFWMRTDETSPGAYDKFRVRLRDSNDYLLQEIDYLDDNSF